MRGRELDWMEIDPAYGSSSRAPFAYFDRDTCSWRTSQGSLLEGSGEFCTIWPIQGSWDRGFAWELAISERRIDESGSSFSLLPTPGAGMVANGNGQTPEARLARGHGPYLNDIGHLLPTPQARDFKGRNQRDDATCLPGAVRLLPTPVVTDSFGARNRTSGRKADSQHHDGETLTDAIWKVQGRETDLAGTPLRGASTLPRSSDGNESSDEELQLRLTNAAD